MRTSNLLIKYAYLSTLVSQYPGDPKIMFGLPLLSSFTPRLNTKENDGPPVITVRSQNLLGQGPKTVGGIPVEDGPSPMQFEINVPHRLGRHLYNQGITHVDAAALTPYVRHLGGPTSSPAYSQAFNSVFDSVVSQVNRQLANLVSRFGEPANKSQRWEPWKRR